MSVPWRNWGLLVIIHLSLTASEGRPGRRRCPTGVLREGRRL